MNIEDASASASITSESEIINDNYSDSDSDSDSDSSVDTDCDDYESLRISKNTAKQFLQNAAAQSTEPETFGWTVNSIEDTITRFRLKKLKSTNQRVYYYDAVYHYIWEHNEGVLKCPLPSIAATLRRVNEINELSFLEQPSEFW